MAKFIDSSALLDQIDKYLAMTLYGCTFRGGQIPPMMLEMRQAVLCDVKQLIYSAPPIDAAPVRRGEWVTVGDDDQDEGMFFCSRCKDERWFGEEVHTSAEAARLCHYCPNCGADTRRSDDDTKTV